MCWHPTYARIQHDQQEDAPKQVVEQGEHSIGRPFPGRVGDLTGQLKDQWCCCEDDWGAHDDRRAEQSCQQKQTVR